MLKVQTKAKIIKLTNAFKKTVELIILLINIKDLI